MIKTISILFLAIVSVHLAVKQDLARPVNIALDYRVSQYTIGKDTFQFPHFIIKSNLTFSEKDSTTQNVFFVPELTLDYTLTADLVSSSAKKEEQWGINCQSKELDDCVPGKDLTQSKDPYQSTFYKYYSDKTVMTFLDKFLAGDGLPVYNIRRVKEFLTPATTPWKNVNAGVIGLGMKSDLLDYIYQQYNVVTDQPYLEKNDYTFGIGIRLNPLKSDDKFMGKIADTFDGSFLTLNGYLKSEINKEQGIRWTKSSETRWLISSADTSLKKSEDAKDDLNIASAAAHCLDYNSAGALILPDGADIKAQIVKYVNQVICQKDQCDDTADIKSGPTLTVTYLEDVDKGENVTITLQPADYIYIDIQDKQVKVSISSMEESILNGRCQAGDTIGLGRMFFLNRYVMFKRSEIKPASSSANADYTWSIGVSDKVQVDDLHQLWLVYTISFSLLGAMILIFIVKTVCLWNRDKKEGENGETKEESGDLYAKEY